MFNKQHGQSFCTTRQCCMSTKRFTEVNLVKWDCTTRCVYVYVLVVAVFVASLFGIKVDSEKVLNVSDKEEHAGQKLRATFINVEYAQKGAQNRSAFVMQNLIYFKNKLEWGLAKLNHQNSGLNSVFLFISEAIYE